MLDAAVGVEGPPLSAGRDEGAVLMLTMKLEQLLGPLGEHADGDHATVDPRSRPTGPGHGTRQHGLGVLTVGTARSTVGQSSLDHGFGCTGSDHRRIGAAAEQQAESVDEEGLARPRLTGEGGHARRQLDGDVVDHAEVANPELDEMQCHRRPGLSDRPGGTWPAGWRGSRESRR